MTARRPTAAKRAERAVLAVLDERWGSTTRDVCIQARLPSYIGTRIDGWAMRRRLLDLAALGWVTTLDGQKPVCWLRTPAGTAALGGGE